VLTLYLLNAGGHSRSSTSIMALASAIIIFWALGRWHREPRRFKTQFIAIAAVVIAANIGTHAFLGKSIRVAILEAQGKSADLTGRTILWEDCIKIGQRNFWLGSGYGAFWTPQVRAEIKIRNTNGPTEAHNGYIETFLNVGIVGVALFAPVILSGLLGAWRMCKEHFRYGRVRFTLLLAALIHNYAESGFPRPTHLIWFLFLLAVVNTWHAIPETEVAESAFASDNSASEEETLESPEHA
jgi:O-antigen ligase